MPKKSIIHEFDSRIALDESQPCKNRPQNFFLTVLNLHKTFSKKTKIYNIQNIQKLYTYTKVF